MGLQHLMRIQIMSKNKDDDLENIVLTDLDTGVTLNIPSSKVVTHDSYKVIRKRYTGHKKVQDISEVGIHTLEKMSKRGK
jgi:hypothetical protein